MARRTVLAGLLAGLAAATPPAAQPGHEPDCVEYPAPDSTLPNGYPFDAQGAVALFRFHRQQEAVRDLDAAREIVRGPWRWGLFPDRREELAKALDSLRDCLATRQPAPLATVTVRVLGYRQDGPGLAPQAGARVFVEEIPVGRTDGRGLLTARVPSGPIGVEAEVAPDQWNWVDIHPEPGSSESIEITLSDGKEVTERTALVLAEAVGDVVPATSKSLTLRFVRGGRLAPVTTIDDVDAVDWQGSTIGVVEEHFAVVGGEIVARDAGAVFDAAAPTFGHPIRLRVGAMAGPNERHAGVIAFHVARSPLSVTLAAPPSNPALPVSGVEVGISLLGGGVGLQRVSDAEGRLHVDAVPHGTVALECETVSGGKYYYGRATLTLSGPRSVTLVLRHADDLIKGVPPLRAVTSP